MLFWKTVKKILIIDDDHTLLRRVSLHFKRYKEIEFLVYDNATEGLFAASELKPSLIILDWTLPDIQGIEVLAMLKKSPNTKDIPVLMLTGHNKIGNIEDAFKIGAEAYMVKPFELKTLAQKSLTLIK